jgi:hypothetical protein
MNHIFISFILANSNKIHGWECAFEDNLEKLRSFKLHDSNQINVNCFNDLLKGFFEFYATFKFGSDSKSNVIISTRSCKLIITSDRENLSRITDIINIQDPFDLSHNLTANVSKNTVEKFQNECAGSNELLSYSEQPRRSSTKCWGLMLLMTKKSLPVVANNTKNLLVSKELVENSLHQLRLSDEKVIKDCVESKENGNCEFKVQKAIDFVVFLLRDCLIFEHLEGDRLITRNKKRIRALNQICEQVDSFNLNCSPKRLKIANNTSIDQNKPTNTYVCVFDENLNNNVNNNHEEFEEDENESGKLLSSKVIASYQFSANMNTWQGRRSIKRDLKQKSTSENINEIDLEKMTSQKLASMNTAANMKSINFKIDFLNENLQEKSSKNLKIKFGLLDDIENQNDLIQFTTLVHFLDVYINNCRDKLYDLWNKV